MTAQFETLCSALGFKIEPRTDSTRIVIVRTDDFRILISFSRDAIDKASKEQLETLLICAKNFGVNDSIVVQNDDPPEQIPNEIYVQEAHGWKVGDYAVVDDEACYGAEHVKIRQWFGDNARRVNAIAHFPPSTAVQHYARVFHTQNGFGDMRNFVKYEID